ncbi:SDR family oxidoreductase [Paenibacillus psychroresistens]|uniref:SDR family oxidoreductase n=1 Tax=Paenibacillus psychroresistens TaxID=1778678 RepID=UPI001390D58C|nr:SDR family oxidoreductase [Paenibacillus psychroresistens]
MRSIEEGMKGKVAIITGASMGIGKACVEAFCYAGVHVVAAARSKDLGEKLAKELTEKGAGSCVFFECDVSKHENVKALIDFTVAQFGRIDVLVNCAGYFPLQRPVDEISVEDFNDILVTNLTAYYAGCKYALPYLRTVKGNIINIGSVLGTTGNEGSAGYCATKGAITTMTKALAVDEARHGVRVNEVKPGHICTEMFELTTSRQKDPEAFLAYSETLQWLGRGGLPEEIATVVLFLASDWASFITGTEILATGGYEIGEGPKKPIFPWTTMEKK